MWMPVLSIFLMLGHVSHKLAGRLETQLWLLLATPWLCTVALPCTRGGGLRLWGPGEALLGHSMGRGCRVLTLDQ